jgi:S-adenosylmethionine-diacylglycerol 3-amino-3-carboxypropyl transferase
MIHNRIKHKGLYSQTLKLLNAETLKEQSYYYQEIENQLWSAFYKWLIKRNTTMALLGVPASQRNIIEEQTEGGLLDFINEAMRTVFTELPIQDNYFWRVYLTGSYSQHCCPNYLKEDNFEFYRNKVSRIKVHNSYLLNFLQENPGSYSHFILLDHQDWLADVRPDTLAMEWQLILENARPGAKILFRSAGRHCNYLPEFIFNHVEFNEEKTERLHAKDRVGTYGSTYLAEVKN